MKFMKILGLLGVAMAAVMALAGSAIATELTYKTPGTSVRHKLGVGGELHAVGGTTTIDGPVQIQCHKTTLNATISNDGNPTVEATINKLEFTECTNDTVTVLQAGKLIFHTKSEFSDNTGTVTSTGTRITVQIHRTVFGFPVTTHCIYVTNDTHLGELTGSDHGNYTTATLHHSSGGIPQEATDGACGGNATLTGTWEFTVPDHLYIH